MEASQLTCSLLLALAPPRCLRRAGGLVTRPVGEATYRRRVYKVIPRKGKTDKHCKAGLGLHLILTRLQPDEQRRRNPRSPKVVMVAAVE